MEGYNKVVLIGTLDSDPELKKFETSSCLKLRLEVLDDNRKQWFGISYWGNKIDFLSSSLKKGVMILVEGSLHNYSYNKEGVKIIGTEIKAREIRILDSEKNEDVNSEFPAV